MHTDVGSPVLIRLEIYPVQVRIVLAGVVEPKVEAHDIVHCRLTVVFIEGQKLREFLATFRGRINVIGLVSGVWLSQICDCKRVIVVGDFDESRVHREELVSNILWRSKDGDELCRFPSVDCDGGRGECDIGV